MALAQVRPSHRQIPDICSNLLHRVEVRLPRTWLAFVEQIAWNYDEESVDTVVDSTVRAATDAALASAGSDTEKEEARRLEQALFMEGLTNSELPEDAISTDLLSPMPSRETSPRRIRPKSKSPARWKIVRAISDAIQDAIHLRSPGVYGALGNLVLTRLSF